MRPITPQPGYTADDLKALLATKRFIYVDCYTFQNKDGVTLRYSTAQRDVNIFASVADGHPAAYTSKEVKVSGIKVEVGVGVEVDEQELDLTYSPTQPYQGIPFAEALLVGRFDGATIRRDRYFSAGWGTPWVGGVPFFIGRTSSLDKVGRSGATMKVKSDLVLFDTQMPRKVYQTGCLHTFGDPGCTINRALFTTAGLTFTGSTDSVILWAGATAVMEKGTIQMVDLGGATQVRTIDDVVVGSVLKLASPLDFDPGAGVHFLAVQGCLKTYAACGDYNNQQNYQGFPFIPVAETASGSL